MNTDGYIKHEFIVQTLQWGLGRLRQVQLQQLSMKRRDITDRHFNWEQLVSGVQGRSDGLAGQNGKYRVVIPVDKHLRWADMRRFKNGNRGPAAAVYNRPTWGVLFGSKDSVYTRLRTGIHDELREQLYESLKKAMEAGK